MLLASFPHLEHQMGLGRPYHSSTNFTWYILEYFNLNRSEREVTFLIYLESGLMYLKTCATL